MKLKVLSFVTEAVVDLLPSPLDIPEARAEKLLCSTSRRFDSLHPEAQKLKQGIQLFLSSKSAIVFYRSLQLSKKLTPMQ